MGLWTWEEKGILGLNAGIGAMLPDGTTPPPALPGFERLLDVLPRVGSKCCKTAFWRLPGPPPAWGPQMLQNGLLEASWTSSRVWTPNAAKRPSGGFLDILPRVGPK